jgi:putative transposase
VSRYRCVDAQKAAGFPVVAACRAAGVSVSAFYAWTAKRKQGQPAAEQAQAELVDEIRTIHRESAGTYGSPRVTHELRRRGWRVNHKRVEQLMAAHGIVGHRPRRRRGLTKADTTPPAPDLVGRLFNPDQPDVAWCGDLTFIPTEEGWLYLASVLDLASRHLVGWSMGTHHDARLVTSALGAAVATRDRTRMNGTIFHTDRGSEYTSTACVDACARLGLRRSMGRTGSCLDNAVAESFFATLKVELVDRCRYRTRAEARASIFAWIHRYNRVRLHSTIGYLPPVEWERQHALDHPYHRPWPHSHGVRPAGGSPHRQTAAQVNERELNDQRASAVVKTTSDASTTNCIQRHH